MDEGGVEQQQQQLVNGNHAVHNHVNKQQHHLGLPNVCSGCGRPIVDQYLLKALDCYWHEDCLKCGCCDCRLGEVGSTLYTRANLILCKRDYLRLFGTSGSCAACSKVIPAFEMVMRAKSNVYHLECFACQQCHQRFCVGDRFYLSDNRILCEYDYEDRFSVLVSANSTVGSSSSSPGTNSGSLGTNGAGPHQHIQRRVSDVQSGGGPVVGYHVYQHQQHQQQPYQFNDFDQPLLDGQRLHRAGMFHQQQLHQLAAGNRLHNLLKHGGSSPSDGSSSGYGSPDSLLLMVEDR